MPPTQEQPNGPLPPPDPIEAANIDSILNNAANAIATLQQKTIAADKKAEIASVIKAMVETITTLKRRDHQPHQHPHHEHPHHECREAFESIKQELAEFR